MESEFLLVVVFQSPMFDGKQAHWHHVKCFFTRNRPKMEGDIENFDTLRWEDQEKLRYGVIIEAKFIPIWPFYLAYSLDVFRIVSFFCFHHPGHIGRSTGNSNPMMTWSVGGAKGGLHHRFREPPAGYPAQLLTLAGILESLFHVAKL